MRGLILVVALVGCARDPVGVPLSRTTDLCEGLVGIEAIGWEYYNGVLVTDPIFPPPVPVGAVFSHPTFPLLGFMHDPSWTAFEVNKPPLLGVNLIRNDDGAIWRYVFVTVPGIPTPADVIEIERGLASDFFGNDQWVSDCDNRGRGEIAPGSGIETSFENRLYRAPDRTLLIAANVTTVPGLGTSSVYVRLLSAPTGEFPSRLYDSFMAIDWQLLVGDPDRQSNDRDGDGVIDDFDRFPDDPTRS